MNRHETIIVEGLGTEKEASWMERTTQWSSMELKGLTQPALLELWGSLAAPKLGDLRGEYTAYTPIDDSLSEEARKFIVETALNENGPFGYFLGKAYMPLGQACGEGYCCFRGADGAVRRYMRFATHLGPSRFDGRLCLVMTYASFKSAAGNLIDEIRIVKPGLFLLLGNPEVPSMRGCVILEGPIRDWVGVDDQAAEMHA